DQGAGENGHEQAHDGGGKGRDDAEFQDQEAADPPGGEPGEDIGAQETHPNPRQQYAEDDPRIHFAFPFFFDPALALVPAFASVFPFWAARNSAMAPISAAEAFSKNPEPFSAAVMTPLG